MNGTITTDAGTVAVGRRGPAVHAPRGREPAKGPDEVYGLPDLETALVHGQHGTRGGAMLNAGRPVTPGKWQLLGKTGG